MDFKQAMSEYLRLRRAYETGQISAELFEQQVNSMVVLHQDQRWMIGVSSGKWYRHDGYRWVEDTPLPPPQDRAPSVPGIQTRPVAVKTEQARVEQTARKRTAQTTKKNSTRLLVILGSVIILIFCIVGLVVGLRWMDIIELPAQIGALNADPTLTNSVTPTHTSTPTLLPPTGTPTALPIEMLRMIPGRWTQIGSDAAYHFYADSTFVYYDPERNLFRTGNYSLLPGNILELEQILVEETLQTLRFDLSFSEKNEMILKNPDGSSDRWNRNGELTASSRHIDPIAVLFELSERLGWDLPDPNCGFDTSDEENEFQFICLDLEDGISLTWVDQFQTTANGRPVERNLLTVSIDHESQESYQVALDTIQNQFESTDPFHGLDAFSSNLDMDWFAIENYAWKDGPWLYRIFRLNSDRSDIPPAGLMLTAETIYEILQGNPPHSSQATVPTQPAESTYLYAENIIGTWEQRDPSKEILIFEADGTYQASSELGNYDYSGNYFFEDDSTVTFELNGVTVNAVVRIEGDVMTLTFNGVDSIYDRID